MFLDILKEHSYDFDQNTFFSFLMFIMQQKHDLSLIYKIKICEFFLLYITQQLTFKCWLIIRKLLRRKNKFDQNRD